MTKYKYIISYWKERGINDCILEYSEFDYNSNLIRTIRYYNKIIRVATENAGSLGEWYENTEINTKIDDFILDLKKSANFIIIESNNEDFEREWKKVTSCPDFILKPYSEYTEKDWIKK